MEKLSLQYSMVGNKSQSIEDLKNLMKTMQDMVSKDGLNLNIKNLDKTTKQLSLVNKEAKQLEKTMKSISGMKLNITSDSTKKLDFAQQKKELNALVNDIKKAQRELDKLNTKKADAMRMGQVVGLFQDKKNQQLDSGLMKGHLSQADYLRISGLVNGINAQTKDVGTQMKRINTELSTVISKTKDRVKMEGEVVKMQTDQQARMQTQAQFLDRIKARSDKMKKDYGTLIDSSGLDKQVKAAEQISNMKFDSNKQMNHAMKMVNGEMDILSTRAMSSKRAMDLSNRSAISFGDALKNAAQKFGLWSAVTVAYYRSIQSFKNGIKVIRDLDSAMVDIQRVTKETAQAYDEFRLSASAIGKEFAKTGVEVAKATTTFARMGYTLKEATDIAKEALLLSNVGNLGVEDASNAMISAVKGFDIPINKIGELNDAMNELGNTMPITVSGLAEALKRSASVMSMTGNTYQEVLALTSTANAVVQNPEKIGNALRTISLRMAGSTDKETGEDFSEIVPKLESDFARLGISLQDTEGRMKSTFQIFKELNQAFKNNNLSDLEKTNILELISGKYNVNVAAAILSNFDEAEKALGIALDSAGSAMRENEKYLDSIQGKTDVLKNTWQEFWIKLINSDSIKRVVDGLTGVVTILVKILDMPFGNILLSMTAWAAILTMMDARTRFFYTSLNKVVTLLGTKTGINFFGSISKQADMANHRVTALSDQLRGVRGSMSANRESVATMRSQLRTPSELRSTAVPQNASRILFSNQYKPKDRDAVEKITNSKTSTSQLMQADKAYKNLTASSMALRAAQIKATASAIAFNAAISIGITVAVGLAYTAITKLINRNKDLARSVEETMNAYRTNVDSINDAQGSISNLVSEYDELSNKQLRTAEESEKLRDVTGEIARLFPDMVSHYDSAGNAVLGYKVNVENLNKELEKQRDLEKDRLLSKGSDIVKAYGNSRQQTESKESNLRGKLGATEGLINYFQSNIKNRPDSILAPTWLKYLDEEIIKRDELNALIRVTTSERKVEANEIKEYIAAVFDELDGAEDLTEEGKKISQSLINGMISEMKSSDITEGNVAKLMQDVINSVGKMKIDINPELEPNAFEHIQRQLRKLILKINPEMSKEEVDEFVGNLMGHMQKTADGKPLFIKTKIDMNEVIEALTELDEALQKANDGYSFSYTEIQKLISKYPELEKSITRTADGWMLEKGALDLVRESYIKQQKQAIDGEIEKSRVSFIQTNKRIDNIAREIKGIQTLGDAYLKASQMASGMGESLSKAGIFGSSQTYAEYVKAKGYSEVELANYKYKNDKLPDGVMTLEQFNNLKESTNAVVDFGKELNELNKLKSQLDDLSKGSILGGSPDKNTDSKEIDTIDKYANAIRELNLQIASLQSTREKLVKGSNAYNENIKKELELIKQKKKLTEEEIVNNAKLIKDRTTLSSPSLTSVTPVNANKVNPIAGAKIPSGFGDKRTYGGNRSHEGIDFMAKEGTPIQAVKSGTVTASGWLELGGWRLSVKDEEGLVHYYAHMMEKSALKAGDKVNIGEVIGKVGSTGYSKVEGTKGKFAPHLHYGVYKNGKAINPTSYLQGSESVSGGKSQNDAIDAYNKALKEQQDALTKDIDLKTTRIELQKQEEELLRSLAESTLAGNDRMVSDIDRQNSQIETRQNLYDADSAKYMDLQAEKVTNLLKKQAVLHQNAQNIRKILGENAQLIADGGEGFLTGDMIESLTDKLKDFGVQWWETEVTIRESKIDERLKQITKFMEDMGVKITPFNNALELMSTKFDLMADIDFSGRMDTLADQFDMVKGKVSLLRGEYSRLSAIQPETKEEAKELADQMTNVATQVFEANKAMYAYARQMEMIRVDEMAHSYSNDMGKLETVLNSFKHNLKMLEGGLVDGTDISMGVGMLPEIPKSALEEKRRELERMMDEQRKYEEEIQRIREMSFEEQEKKNSEFNTQMREFMLAHYDEMINNVANSLGTELNLQNTMQSQIFNTIRESLFGTEMAYANTWDNIVNRVLSALATIKNAQAQMNSGDVSEIPAYANGTKGHKGGLALVGEEGEELGILPSGKQVLLGRGGANLVNLPKGTQVIPHGETKELMGFLGNSYNAEKIPKYASGTFSILKAITSAVSKAVSSVTSSGGSSSASTGRSSSNQQNVAQHTNLRNVQSGQAAGSNFQQGKITTNPYNGSTVYEFANYDETGKFMGYSSSLDNNRSNALKGATHVVAANGKIYTTSFGNSIQDKPTISPQQQPQRQSIQAPNFSFSSASPDYYKQEKSAHEKQIDKIRYDSFLTKAMAAEFKAYSADREATMKIIEQERDVIKKHFSNGGLRETIESQIQSLIEKVDSQTLKDAQMQFKMTEDVLKQQKKIAEDYMKTTANAYLNGVNSGMGVDALRKLRDEYSDAQREVQSIEEAIKSNIKSRFDFEFAMMDKRMEKYRKQQDDISFKMNILNTATSGKDHAQQMAYNEQIVGSYKNEITALAKELKSFQSQQGKFGVGSYEWNILQDQIDKVNDSLKDVNLSMVQTIANNKKLANDRLARAFENQNKELEKMLFDGDTRKDAERALNKQKETHYKFLEGLEKEYALDMLIRDLRMEEITVFDEKIKLAQESEKLTRDEYETLRKSIEIKKMEIALEKLKGNKSIQQLAKDDEGNWNFEWVADERAIKELEDRLTEAKIDMMNWNKELEFKTEDMSMQEKLDFMDRLNDIQQKALNEEYKSSSEFINDLKEIGLSMDEYSEWAESVKDKLISDTGNFDGLFATMSTSFTEYTTELNSLNARLEALIIALGVDKNINLNDAFNNIQSFDTGGYTGSFNKGKLAVLHEKELVLNQDDTKNILDIVKMARGFDIKSVTASLGARASEIIKEVIYQTKVEAIFPNAENWHEINKALMSLPQSATAKSNPVMGD